MGGGVKLPEVPERVTVAPADRDAGARIQAAIDKVSAMPAEKSGFRGAVLIKRGVYKIDRPLRITTSGVVLRGEGQGEKGTVLVATQRKQHALIEIAGKSFGKGRDRCDGLSTLTCRSVVMVSTSTRPRGCMSEIT